ncbi:MAG: aconitase family protein [Thermoanaerobaculia bacterium]
MRTTRSATPRGFAVFEDHLIYADDVPKMRGFLDKIEILRTMQREFQRHTGVRDFSARDGVSPGICHEVAREQLILPGQFIQATDSHTCMGGCNNALAWGSGPPSTPISCTRGSPRSRCPSRSASSSWASSPRA